MNPHASDDRMEQRIEQRLREGARTFAPAPPPELRARILAALRAGPAPAPRQEWQHSQRRGNWLAAAAAVIVLGGAWMLTERREREPAGTPVVALSRDLLGAGARVLSLPRAAEDRLRTEAERLLTDTTRVAAGVLRGLPAPLRAGLERAALQRM